MTKQKSIQKLKEEYLEAKQVRHLYTLTRYACRAVDFSCLSCDKIRTCDNFVNGELDGLIKTGIIKNK